MSQAPMRYLLFADVLGTEALYAAAQSKSHMIERKRIELEYCARISLYPYLSTEYGASNHLSLFSDTILFACEDISALLEAAAQLFYLFSQHTFRTKSVDGLFLLRGGIAYGRALKSDALSSSSKVTVAKIFDTSLALSYRLGGIRRGSRIFLCKDTYEATLASGNKCCFKWASISGIGPPITPAFEYTWPTVLLRTSVDRFCLYLTELMQTWLHLFRQRDVWDVSEYDQTLYQLDETIKLCIRASMCAPEHGVGDVFRTLKSMLPSVAPELAELDTRFTWGTWLQIFWAMLSLIETHPTLCGEVDIRDLLRTNMDIIHRKDYSQTFRTELHQPDYCYLRRRLLELNVIKY